MRTHEINIYQKLNQFEICLLAVLALMCIYHIEGSESTPSDTYCIPMYNKHSSVFFKSLPCTMVPLGEREIVIVFQIEVTYVCTIYRNFIFPNFLPEIIFVCMAISDGKLLRRICNGLVLN